MLDLITNKLSNIDFRIQDVALLTLLLGPFYFVSKVYFYSSPDEYYYIFTAIRMAEGGAITIPLASPLLRRWFVPTVYSNHYISPYPIGLSVLLALFYIMGGYRFMFFLNGIVGILTVIMTYFTAFEISKNRVCSLLSALLLGIMPPVVFYSRTLLRDPSSTLFLLLSFYLYLKASHRDKPSFYALASLSLGYALLIRYTNIVFVIPILINHFRKRRDKPNSILLYYVFLLPFFVVIGLYNLYYFGDVFSTGYHVFWSYHQGGLVGRFNFLHLIFHLPQYFLILNIFPPLGLLTTLLYIRHKADEEAYILGLLVIISFLIFFSSYFLMTFDIEHLFIESSRHLQVILPYLCMNTIRWFQQQIRRKQTFLGSFALVFIIFSGINIGIVVQQNAFLTRLADYQDMFYTHTEPESLIIGDRWHKLFETHISQTYEDRYYVIYATLSENEMMEELLPLIDSWMIEKSVYFVDDPYSNEEKHDFILRLLMEHYRLNLVISTEQPYEIKLFELKKN